MTTPLKPLENESYEQYLLRMGDNKDQMESMSWNRIASLMNDYLNEDFSESKYRKEYHLLKRGKEIGVFEATENDQIKELEDKAVELQKQKYQFQDQKREMNTKIRQMARFEHMKEEVTRAIENLKNVKPLNFKAPHIIRDAKTKANVLWSDFHVGMETNNSLNTYNVDVFERRFTELVNSTIYYCEKHNVNELVIGQLGDSINGLIHVTSRIESGEDVIAQTQRVSERLSEAVAEISKYVNKVKFINIVGNHSRAVANKQDALIRENFEMLIPWYMESRLKDHTNVEIINSRDGYYVDNTFNEPHLYIHGDLDHVSSVARSIPQFLGIIPKYSFSGHIHHDTVKDYGRTLVVSNGSLCGADEYAVSKRMYSEAMQKMHIFRSDGRIEYKIDIPLQDIV